jgi:tetratricopeptide (TPR) repeat protein
LGVLAHQTGNQEAAIQLIQNALHLRPDLPEAHYNLGNAYRAHDKLNEAVASYREAVRLKPDLAEAHGNLGCALTELGEFAEASASCRRAVLLQPLSPDAHGNLGSALAFQGHLEEAAECYRQALRLNPNHVVAHRDLGVYWLLKGDYQRGWPEHEWRVHCRADRPRNFGQPRWDGSLLLGKSILLHAEQGLGDTLQFVRFGKASRWPGNPGMSTRTPVAFAKLPRH